MRIKRPHAAGDAGNQQYERIHAGRFRQDLAHLPEHHPRDGHPQDRPAGRTRQFLCFQTDR